MNTKAKEIPLSDNFFMSEVTESQTASRLGLDNTLPTELLGNVINTATQMEKVRALLGNLPITINSWYRSVQVNRAVGGATTSQHMTGKAVDFVCPKFGRPLEIVKLIAANSELFRFDQLILEHTWVHISFELPLTKGRKEVLTLLDTGKYAKGITTKKGVPV
jgi:hypothetical protein